MRATSMTRYTLADLRKAAPGSRVVPRHPGPRPRSLVSAVTYPDPWRTEARKRPGRALCLLLGLWPALLARVCRAQRPAHRRAAAFPGRFRGRFKGLSESRLLTPERRAAWRAAA